MNIKSLIGAVILACVAGAASAQNVIQETNNSYIQFKVGASPAAASEVARLTTNTLIVSGTVSSTRYVGSGASLTNVAASTNVQTFTVSGTWTRPSQGNMVFVQCWGAGTGGWRVTAGGGFGYSGAGGAYDQIIMPYSGLPTTVTVTIGVGGSGGTVNNSQSGMTAGGDSTFGNYVLAPGATGWATGGQNVSNTTYNGAPGNYNAVGDSALYGGAGGGASPGGYAGGTSTFGGSGGTGSAISGAAPTAGSQPGGGGGEGYNANGGKGGNGKCVAMTI